MNFTNRLNEGVHFLMAFAILVVNGCGIKRFHLEKPAIMSSSSFSRLKHADRKRLSLDTFYLKVQRINLDSHLMQQVASCHDSFEIFFRKLAIDKYWCSLRMLDQNHIAISATNSFRSIDKANIYSLKQSTSIYGGFDYQNREFLIINHDDDLNELWRKHVKFEKDSIVIRGYRVLYKSGAADLLYKYYHIATKMPINSWGAAKRKFAVDSVSLDDPTIPDVPRGTRN